MLRLLRVSGLAVATALASSTLPARALDTTAAAAPAVASPAPPPSRAAQIIGPLKEIGHVTARTPFCAAFMNDSSEAASAAVAYEFALLRTSSDVQRANTDDSLRKSRSTHALTQDLQLLANLANEGRSKLRALKAVAAQTNDPELQKQVDDFRNALDGAKARQMELARKMSSAIAKFEEDPVYSVISTPLDSQIANSDGRLLLNGAQSYYTEMTNPDAYWDQAMADQHEEVVHALFQGGPDDYQIGDDLERAGEKATLVVQLGKC